LTVRLQVHKYKISNNDFSFNFFNVLHETAQQLKDGTFNKKTVAQFRVKRKNV